MRVGALLYFAYGSNLWLPRLRRRVPGVQPLGAALLRGFSLRWHKRSHDGSGKCGIAVDEGGIVHGGLFRIPPPQRPRLDRVEELGVGYADLDVRVETGSAAHAAYTYVALPRARAEGLRPYRWYRDLVVAGARWHGLPDPYVRQLADVAVARDLDAGRSRRERASLALLP
ncbi:MAG: gamma-glutamylcyclotransferase [Gemmatimonadetes bacterium]|nr:gamma-glutamylcyclotransferase [Gemmatimonadota bacterium]